VPRQTPTDAKRLVGVISLIGGSGGTPSRTDWVNLAKNHMFASLEDYFPTILLWYPAAWRRACICRPLAETYQKGEPPLPAHKKLPVSAHRPRKNTDLLR
jgi:hypothetical protein